MGLNLVATVVNFLKENPQQKYKAREIAEWIFKTYPDECRTKIEESSSLGNEVELVQQLVAEISSQRPRMQKKYPHVKTTEGRPKKYYWSDLTDQLELDYAEAAETIPSENSKTKTTEHALYPVLSEYLWNEHGIYPLRIDEKKSSNKRGPQGNKWLYPDLVGMEDLTSEWTREVKECVNQYGDRRSKLWSFEVKILINRSNVREVFFQAVSNSSWANCGYLVAAEIEGADTMKELRMLFALHGIGLIQLDVENPSESQILIPAKERNNVDWATANRITDENKDFRKFIKLVRQFYQTGEHRHGDWDIPEEVK